MLNTHTWKRAAGQLLALATLATPAFASESDIHIPDLKSVNFFGGSLSGMNVLMIGLVVCALGVAYGWMQYIQTKNLQVHRSMSDVSRSSGKRARPTSSSRANSSPCCGCSSPRA